MSDHAIDRAERAYIANRVREARVTIGLTQDDVARVLNVSRSAVSDIESGKRRLYGLELRRLARLYRRPVGWFLGEESPPISAELIAATAGLTERDRQAVYQFARFLAHQARLRKSS